MEAAGNTRLTLPSPCWHNRVAAAWFPAAAQAYLAAESMMQGVIAKNAVLSRPAKAPDSRFLRPGASPGGFRHTASPTDGSPFPGYVLPSRAQISGLSFPDTVGY